MARHNELGKTGEDFAAKHLLAKGHRIIARNYRFQKAEVDIVSQIGSTIVFTEVKTRSSLLFGYPEQWVTKKKKTMLQQAMEEYIRANQLTEEARFDIIAIVSSSNGTEIHHIEDAFYH